MAHKKKQPFIKFTRTERLALLGAGFIWGLVALVSAGLYLFMEPPAQAQTPADSTVQTAALQPPTPRPTLPPTPTATRVASNLLRRVPPPTPTFMPQVAIHAPAQPAAVVEFLPTASPQILPTFTATPAPQVVDNPPVQPASAALQLPTPQPTLPPTPTATRIVPDMLPEIAAATSTAVPQVAPVFPTATQLPATATRPSVQAAPVSSQQPTHMTIDAVGIDSRVISVGWYPEYQDGQETLVWEVADYAVGWHQNSALPGQKGNMVLTAHSNISGEVFRPLHDINLGDVVTVYVGAQAYHYVVAFTTVVKEAGQPREVRRQNARWIAPTDDERLTLVTCWPYPSNTHRMIVVARPIR